MIAPLDQIVVDASVGAKWLFNEADAALARSLLDGDRVMLVPDIFHCEIANAVWKRVRKGEIARSDAAEMVSWLEAAPVMTLPSLALLEYAFSIAERYDRAVYEAVYVALAVRESCTLVASDAPLMNALAGSPYERHIRPLASLSTPKYQEET